MPEVELARHGESGAPDLGTIAPLQIDVRSLSVGALARELLQLGDIGGLASYAKIHAHEVRAVVWNETGISLVMSDRGAEVRFTPEIYPETEMFLRREHKRERNGFDGPSGSRVWEGEFEPVLFAKKDLVKFLAKHSGGDAGLLESIKTLRVTKRTEETEKMLDLDSDNVERTEVETEVTNIPRHFSMQMRVTEGIDAVFEFEAALYRPDRSDDYLTRSEAKTKRIAVRAVNARPVLRDVMQNVLARLPPGIPQYYGRFGFKDPVQR